MSDVDNLQNAEEWAGQREQAAAEENRAALRALRDELAAAQQRPIAQRGRDAVMVAVSKLSLVTNIRTGELPDIHGLAMNIREVGQIHPLLVKPDGPDTFKVITGKRRFVALQDIAAATGEDIMARCEVVVDAADEDNVYLWQLSENLGREDMAPLAVARGLRAALKADETMSASRLARSLGKSPAWASRHLHLLDLPQDIQERIDDGDLTFTIADLLRQGQKKGIITEANISDVAARVSSGEASVDELKTLVRPKPAGYVPPPPANYEELSRELDAARWAKTDRGFEPSEAGTDAAQADWEADERPGPERPRLTPPGAPAAPAPWETATAADPAGEDKRFRPARERYGVRQLEAYLIGRLLGEHASDRLREALSVTEQGAFAWAWELTEEDRRSALLELAADLVQRADGDLPAVIFPADSQ